MPCESDSEDQLPPGWCEKANKDGFIVYSNSMTGVSSQRHPLTQNQKCVPLQLPFGWTEEFEENQRIFSNFETGQQTTVDPRLAFKKEVLKEYRQRFDSSSSCWDVLDGVDLSNQTVLVTGGSTGIGWQTAISLATHGAEVIVTSRNVDKSERKVRAEKSKRPMIRIRPMFVDFASLESVRKLASEITQSYRVLNILILNAGIYGYGYGMTNDGFEHTFQVNYLAQFYLFRKLASLLECSAPSKVIVVSSESFRMSFLSKPEHLSGEYLSPKMRPFLWNHMAAYNDSKLCNILFARELDRRFAGKGLRAFSVHPGNMIRTSITRSWWLLKVLFFLVSPFTKSISQGAATIVYAAVSPDIANAGGIYLNNCCPCEVTRAGEDDKMADTLWILSEKMLSHVNIN